MSHNSQNVWGTCHLGDPERPKEPEVPPPAKEPIAPRLPEMPVRPSSPETPRPEEFPRPPQQPEIPPPQQRRQKNRAEMDAA